MNTVADLVEQIVNRRPFVAEALQDGLINASALARQMMPELAQKTGRPIKLTTIVMAINRMDLGLLVYESKKLNDFFKKLKDILVRGHLSVYTLRQSPNVGKNISVLLNKIGSKPEVMCAFSQGVAECTIIISESESAVLEKIFSKEEILEKEVNLSAFTLLLPQENRVLSGVYYYILRQLAWHDVNVVEVVSTSNEFTIVVEEKMSGTTFEVLRKLGKN